MGRYGCQTTCLDCLTSEGLFKPPMRISGGSIPEDLGSLPGFSRSPAAAKISRMPGPIHHEIERIFHASSRSVFAPLARYLRDFGLAEEALQEAFAIAAERWTVDGVPENPTAWLVSTGRFKLSI